MGPRIQKTPQGQRLSLVSCKLLPELLADDEVCLERVVHYEVDDIGRWRVRNCQSVSIRLAFEFAAHTVEHCVEEREACVCLPFVVVVCEVAHELRRHHLDILKPVVGGANAD